MSNVSSRGLTAGSRPIISLQGSKSITNRVVTLAGMSRHPTLIKNFLFSSDTEVGLECLKKLGFEVMDSRFRGNDRVDITTCDDNSVLITPPDFKKLNAIQFYDQTFELNMGNAGTMARFFPAVVLNWTKTFPESKPISAIFHAHSQLSKRPITPIFDALKKLGANIEGENYPFKIHSSNLNGKTEINTEQSSQFLSGLLIAACRSGNKIEIERTSILPQPDYVLITIDLLKKFDAQIYYSNELKNFTCHAKVQVDNSEDWIPRSSRGMTSSTLGILPYKEFFVEPDASTACYYLALAFIHNFTLTIKGLGKKSLQPDVNFYEFLQKMGAHIQTDETEITLFKRDSSIINGGFTFDFSLMSDQALTAAVLALFANDTIKMTGVAHIRHHECDRIACLVQNFKNFNFSIVEQKDGFIIFPEQNKYKEISGIWNTHHDHRFAMSGFLLNSFNRNVIIENPECVSKTAPTFFHDAKNILNYHSIDR